MEGNLAKDIDKMFNCLDDKKDKAKAKPSVQ